MLDGKPNPKKILTIALDYDGTYTADPDLWLAFILNAQSRGHEVILVTMRTFEELENIDPRLDGVIFRRVPTARAAKMKFCESFDIRPDIWIDDQPHFLFTDAK
jgi:hypothetical protein